MSFPIFPFATTTFEKSLVKAVRHQRLPSSMMAQHNQHRVRIANMAAARRQEDRQIQQLKRRDLATPDTVKRDKAIASPAKHMRPAQFRCRKSQRAINALVGLSKGCFCNTKLWTRQSSGIGGELSRAYDDVATMAATLCEAGSDEDFEACADGLLHLLDQTERKLKVLGLGPSILVAGTAMKELHKLLTQLEQWAAAGQVDQAWSRYYDGIVKFFGATQITRDDVRDLRDLKELKNLFPKLTVAAPDAMQVEVPDSMDVEEPDDMDVDASGAMDMDVSGTMDVDTPDVVYVAEDDAKPMDGVSYWYNEGNTQPTLLPQGNKSTWTSNSGSTAPPVDWHPEISDLKDSLPGSIPSTFPPSVARAAASTLPEDMDPRTQPKPVSFGLGLEQRPVPSNPPTWITPSSTVAPATTNPRPAVGLTFSGMNFLPSMQVASTAVASNPSPMAGQSFSGLGYLPSRPVASETSTTSVQQPAQQAPVVQTTTQQSAEHATKEEVKNGTGAFHPRNIICRETLVSFFKNKHFQDLVDEEAAEALGKILDNVSMTVQDVEIIERTCDWLLMNRRASWFQDLATEEEAVDRFRQLLKGFMDHALKKGTGGVVTVLKTKVRNVLDSFAE